MPKHHANFVCQSCGAVYNRWKGKCEACGGWNSIVEETGSANPMAGPVATRPARAKGRVSMDLIVVDVTDVPGVERGTPVTLIGDGLSVDEVGRRAGTIGYEILTSLGRRYARTYINP